ncbi:ornithine cyclodeaminase family protein [Atopobacter phocae]|uniref:ornithine cyclodeaminase family protein n=1 Tax=Atopobacter phocae TaxID=136492 RepID=UPI00047184CB|nr:ornithine cyclodeaminase family protein [Atopobacter phocae]
MLILTKEDIQKCFSMTDAIRAAKESLKIYTAGDANVPLRTNLNVEKFNGQSLYMPAVSSGEQSALGVKIVSVYPDNIQKNLPSVPATMVALDPETGIVSAILDGTYLTQLRTAAVQGAATEELSNTNAKIGALIGTGGQGYQQAIAMMTARELTELRVFDIDFDRAQQFAKELALDMQGVFQTKIKAVKTSKEAVLEADIVTTVTTSKVNTFDADDLKPGVHVNGMGAYTPDMLELPSKLLTEANAVIFDTKDGVLAEAGDIQAPIKEGLMTAEDYTGELGELLLDKIEGRTSEQDVTVFKSVGSAVLDIVTAQQIIEKAMQQNIGTTIDF